MVGSTLRNALARRNHKERSQPAHRKRLGLLEKHKDYVHRARDYKSKQDRLKKLKEKAAFRNKDEFYFGMVKAKTKNGVQIGDRGNEALDADTVMVLKSQDEGWIRVQVAKDEKKISNIRAELERAAPSSSSSEEWSAAAELAEVEKLAAMGIVLRPRTDPSSSTSGAARARKTLAKENPDGHVLFAEDKEEFQSYGKARFRVEDGTTREEGDAGASEEEDVDLGWEVTTDTKNKSRSKSSAVTAEPTEEELEAEAQEIREHRLDLLSTLSALLARQSKLRSAADKIANTKARMGKGAHKKVKEGEWVEDESVKEDRNGERKRWVGKEFKWKMERRK